MLMVPRDVLYKVLSRVPKHELANYPISILGLPLEQTAILNMLEQDLRSIGLPFGYFGYNVWSLSGDIPTRFEDLPPELASEYLYYYKPGIVVNLEFSVRALRGFERADVHTIGELVRYRDRFSKMANFGQTTILEVASQLKTRGIIWGVQKTR